MRRRRRCPGRRRLCPAPSSAVAARPSPSLLFPHRRGAPAPTCSPPASNPSLTWGSIAGASVGSYQLRRLLSLLRHRLSLLRHLYIATKFLGPACTCTRGLQNPSLGLGFASAIVGCHASGCYPTPRCRRRAAEREVRVNGSWPQVPTSGFSLFLEDKDLQRSESVEWVNMVLGKLWKVYHPGIEGWIVGLLQPVVDNLQKPDYVNRVEIRQIYLGEEPLSVSNVERLTSRRANDLQTQTQERPIDRRAAISADGASLRRSAQGAQPVLRRDIKLSKLLADVAMWPSYLKVANHLWLRRARSR